MLKILLLTVFDLREVESFFFFSFFFPSWQQLFVSENLGFNNIKKQWCFLIFFFSGGGGSDSNSFPDITKKC